MTHPQTRCVWQAWEGGDRRPGRPARASRLPCSTTLGRMVLVQPLTAAILAGLAALHVAWGCGSPFPFRTRDDLADAVVGSSAVPRPAACMAVAGALAASAVLVAGVGPQPPRIRRPFLLGVSSALGLRGLLGWTGKTEAIAHGSNSERFVQLDRHLYSPLCVALSIGALAARQRSRTPS